MSLPTPDNPTVSIHQAAALPDGPCHTGCTHSTEPKEQPFIISPLNILAKAVESVSIDADRIRTQQPLIPFPSDGQHNGFSPIDRCLVGYFGEKSTKNTWSNGRTEPN
jgi:hypothetical protein